MSKRQDDFAEINAYVDGELGVEARAAVSERAAQDPNYAHQLATVSRLKAVTTEAIPVPDLTPPARSPAKRVRRLALAASLVLFAVSGLGWATYNATFTDAREPMSLAWSITVHRGWTPPDKDLIAPPSLQAMPAALNPNVPDLSASGLDIVHIAERTLPSENAQALVIGYLGTRGCRVTMIVSRSVENTLKEPVRMESGGILAFMWQAGPLHYAVLAEGMAPGRYDKIARGVRKATIDRLPLDRETRTALAHDRAKSPPCRA